MFALQFDGMLQILSRKTGHSGLLGYGWQVSNEKTEIARGFGLYAHRYTAHSNIAEYLALLEGLEALTDMRLFNELVEIRGDAKCVIDQMKGNVAISSHLTRKLHRRVRSLAANFSSLEWTWIPRKENRLADQLSRRGLRNLYCLPDSYEKAINRLNSDSAARGGLISLFDLHIYMSARQ
jgi:ribonuclease HI